MVGVGRRVWIRIRCNSCGHGCAVPSGTSALTRRCGRCSKCAATSTAGCSCELLLRGRGTLDRQYGVESCLASTPPLHERPGGRSGDRTRETAGETHPGAIVASQATARSPPYALCPKHITLQAQPVEGAIPNRWRANPVIIRPYGPFHISHTNPFQIQLKRLTVMRDPRVSCRLSTLSL